MRRSAHAVRQMRARKMARDLPWEVEQLRSRHMREGLCMYCRKIVGWSALTLEHIEPLSRGGRHSLSNTAHVCSPCNFSKGRRFLLEWIVRRPDHRPPGAEEER
jgi:5-methylcytosine-specific restriction endonuclease McrA